MAICGRTAKIKSSLVFYPQHSRSLSRKNEYQNIFLLKISGVKTCPKKFKNKNFNRYYFFKGLLEAEIEVILEVGDAAVARVKVERRNNFGRAAVAASKEKTLK